MQAACEGTYLYYTDEPDDRQIIFSENDRFLEFCDRFLQKSPLSLFGKEARRKGKYQSAAASGPVFRLSLLQPSAFFMLTGLP